MRRIVQIAALVAMVLALAGTAMASSKISVGDCVRFTKNTVAYHHKNGKASHTIVRKDSYALVKTVSGSWVELYLNPIDPSITRWFKTDNLKVDSKGKELGDDTYFYIYVVYSQGGIGKSHELYVFDDTDPYSEYDFDNFRISPRSRTMPTICAARMNLSLGFRPVIIS